MTDFTGRMNAIKAEDIAHVLRDGVALLPGCRCRSGGAVLVFPSREQPINTDHLRNVLLYLLTVTADSIRDKGILVVIDMRGKQTWTNVKPILKALNSIGDNTPVAQTLIIKPDKLWEKQKTQLSLGSYRFKVDMVSMDNLSKVVDVSQLPRVVGGSHPYDHDEWLEIRVDLEKWIWNITDVMGGLELVRKEMCESEQPIDVKTAESAVKRHAQAKKTIFAVPLDRMENDAKRICDRIKFPRSGQQNPDLLSALPHVGNLVDSLRLLKAEVFKQWDGRRGELEKVYQHKLLEHDAENMLHTVRSYCTTVCRSMGDVGVCETDVARLCDDFDQFQMAVETAQVTVEQVINCAKRLIPFESNGRTNVEVAALRLQDEWMQLQDLMARRRLILGSARAFFVSSQKYFSELPTWSSKPGVEPSDVMMQNADVLEEAIKRHDTFWAHVEEIYAQAFDDGSKVTKALKEAEIEDNVAREQLNRLTRAHKQLHDKWKEKRVLLHHMLAMIAFETDVKLVVEWLDLHGEPYLTRSVGIGENVMNARALQRNHLNFQKVAANTYDNVKKLYQVFKNVTESGSRMCNVEQMRSLMTDLDARIKRFTKRVETRSELLKLSVLFHTHYIELTNWFDEMRKKFDDKFVDLDVETCERSKERWVLETDETAQAYAVTVGEGKQLVQELQKSSNLFEVDYSQNITHIQRLISDIDERNGALSNEWAPQRVILQIGLKFAQFVRNYSDVLQQLTSWEDDMRDMVNSDTFIEKAETVSPYHKDNQKQVRTAINNIRKTAKELNQALHSHGIADLSVRDGRRVADLVREHIVLLDRNERDVMKVAEEVAHRIEAASEVIACRGLANRIMLVIENKERHLADLGGIPVNCREAESAQDKLKEFQEMINKDNRLYEPYNLFNRKFRQLIEEGQVERDLLVMLNEHIHNKYRRLIALVEERKKLLTSAITCYKTHEDGVLPILQQLAKEYSQPHKDWCTQCPSNSHQEKVNYVANLLSRHMEYKDRFIRGCTYAQKNGLIFLRYIQRTNVSQNERMTQEDRIMRMRADLRDRQSSILEMWMKKKKQLDRCQEYVLLDASSRQIIEWLTGEGENMLNEYQKRSRIGGGAQKNIDDFLAFKLQVKEQRTKTQAFLMLAVDIKDREDTDQHKEDIERCINEVRLQFEKFSKRVAECDVVLRGGNAQSTREEFSLDRHSDSSIDDKLVKERREENRKMLEPMRELIKSERDYIEDLRRCVDVYVKGYDEACRVNTCPISLRPLRSEIFGNIERIFEFHNEKLMHELIKYETQPEAVGASFTVWIDVLNELYTDYCVNKEQKNYVIATPDSVSFFNAIREKHGLEINNDLGSLLIKPVQRITRYRLLMEQLLKNCQGNADELKEAYEVVISVPRRVNDIIHYNCLDLKDSNVDVLGPFVIQDTLTVWEPRAYFKGRGKERQVFLFELAIVFAKRLEINPKTIRYVIKGKPLSLSDVSVVEHVEGDTCRFGLRIGATAVSTAPSNDNRTDMRANTEQTKVMWVRKIRELTQGLLSLNLGVPSTLSVPSTISGTRSVSTRSVASSSSDRLSQDVEGMLHHRHSVQSSDGMEQSSEHWIVTNDFDGQAEGHIRVSRGERVEISEEQATDGADYVTVVVVDDPTRHGLVPTSILAPPESGSVPDRPDDAGSASTASKRKSLRRIFANSSKEQRAGTSAAKTSNNTTLLSVNGHSDTASSSTPLTVLSSASTDQHNEKPASSSSVPVNETTSSSSPLPTPSDTINTTVEDEKPVEDCLPPPMQNITLNNSSTEMEEGKEGVDATPVSNEAEAEESPVVPQKVEKTPEETARFKRQYVLMELVETEQDYVRDLSAVVEGYIGNLEKMDLPADLIGKDKIIFANIGNILDFHKTCFLKEIEKCQENYEHAGHAFVKYERRLRHLYVIYCQNKPKSDYLVSQEDFEGFFAETKAKLGHKVALCDLLIKPVQRIMKYQLLLKDILKFTERANDRVDVLKKALAVMNVVPKACDDMMQVGRIQNFDGNLQAQGRLIHQGTLQISESTAGTTQKPKDRRIFLFEQSAIIADHIPPKKEFGNPLYIFKNIIMVNKMMFESNVTDDPLRFVIRSSDPAQPTAFIANAQTQEEKDEWNRKIGEQLDQQKRLLAALVDPKRYMGGADDLGSSMGNMNIGAPDKKAPAAPGRGPVAPAAGSSSKKAAESPKKESKGSKLFSFGKKPAKSPTSPPPVGNSK